MPKKSIAISNFQILRPRYETSQQQTLDWLVEAHVKAESIDKKVSSDSLSSFRKILSSRLHHVGCKPSVIAKRGHDISDFLHLDWREMEIYRLEAQPCGLGLDIRSNTHQKHVESAVENFYAEIDRPPENMLHVSCTGYESPSGLQKMASKKKWGGHSNITHVYHMGCYASLPALRIGSAFVKSEGGVTDIIHTELCSLHNNPLQHSAEFLVAQSLFADGYIKYSLVDETLAAKAGKAYLRILGVYEEIIPETILNMAWSLSDWGFKFVLTKEIPRLLKANLRAYLVRLCQKCDVDERMLLDQGIFAIHPGGPKILDYIQAELMGQDEQLKTSREILKNYGNMSSATLPHVWEKICQDANISAGTKILSLAFGPGLNIAGVILEKVG